MIKAIIMSFGVVVIVAAVWTLVCKEYKLEGNVITLISVAIGYITFNLTFWGFYDE